VHYSEGDAQQEGRAAQPAALPDALSPTASFCPASSPPPWSPRPADLPR